MPESFRGVITIDGPAGVGKSTLARRLASELKVAYLDTGAMYRTLGLHIGAKAADMDEESLRAQCRRYRFSLEEGQEGLPQLFCNGIPVGPEIRTEKAARMASLVARLPVLREELQAEQRRLGSIYSLVAEGRDMGTKVFPDASCKFFLDARSEVRALRRYLELEERGTLNGSTLEEIRRSIEERDKQDRGRAIDPLTPAEDATLVDTSDLDLAGVLRVLLNAVAAKSMERKHPSHAVASMTVDPSEMVFLEKGKEGFFMEACQKGNRAAGAIAAWYGLTYSGSPVCSMDGRKITAEAEIMDGERGVELALSAVQVVMASVAAHIPGEHSLHIVLSCR